VRKLKKILILLVFLLIINVSSFSYAEDLTLSGEGAILIDVDSSEVLYEKNGNSKFFPASTTKIMTAILAIENSNLNDIVTIDQEVVDLTDGSHIALEPGEELTLEQLLHALLIQSANDAALGIAKHTSGSIDKFVALMNAKAKELGAVNTNFVNPNGLHDESHYTTAYDLALITRYAMKNETFKTISTKPNYIIPITNKKTEDRYLNTTNKIFNSNEKINIDGNLVPIKYDGVNCGKTGYTQVAQNCLVTSLEKEGHKLISVVLKSNGKEVYADTHKLLNYGIENFDKINVGFANKFIHNFKVDKGLAPFVSGVTKTDSFALINKAHKGNIQEKLILEESIKAPILKNQTLGKVQYFLNDKMIAETDIVSTMDVQIDPKSSLLMRILSKWYIFAGLLLIIIRIAVLNRKRKLRRLRRSRLYRV
jgi:D-alanyl-D-alanine carboxypeptidase (penicillin-binding protein 5/6)